MTIEEINKRNEKIIGPIVDWLLRKNEFYMAMLQFREITKK